MYETRQALDHVNEKMRTLYFQDIGLNYNNMKCLDNAWGTCSFEI